MFDIVNSGKSFLSGYLQAFVSGGNEALLFGYLQAGVVAVAGIVAIWLLFWRTKRALRRMSEKTDTKYDDLAYAVVSSVSTRLLYLLVILISLSFFAPVSEGVQSLIHAGEIIVLVLLISNGLIAFIGLLIEIWIGANSASQSIKSLGDIAHTIVKVVVWLFAVVTILANFGVDVTAFIAGIGISGIAIGLATQKILADVFSAFVIFLDKNVLVGDFVQVGSISGTVEKIGIKTTHIRAASGEEIIVPNEQITSTIVYNNRTLKRRRVVLEMHVNDNTSVEQLERIPEIIEKAAESLETIELNRCHLEDFGSGYFLYQIVYYESSSDFKTHKTAVGQFNLSVIEQMSRAKIDVVNPRGLGVE